VFVIDARAANKPAKPVVFHGYINGKRAPQSRKRIRRGRA
jgi:hypothetical protein